MYREMHVLDNLEEIRPWLEGKRIATFGVVGGLLRSDFLRPEYMFSYMETYYEVPGFARERILAERRLRSKYGVKWDIESIYKALPIPPEVELSLALESYKPHPLSKSIFEMCEEMGLELVALSDSPFPEEYLRLLLLENRFRKAEQIEIQAAAETGKTKKSYQAYQELLKSRGLEPAQVFHFGGDPYNDLSVPRDIGMDVVQVLPVHEGFRRKLEGCAPVLDAALDLLMKCHRDHEMAMLIGTVETALSETLQENLKTGKIDISPRLVVGHVLLGPALAALLYHVAERYRLLQPRMVLVFEPSGAPAVREMILMGARTLGFAEKVAWPEQVDWQNAAGMPPETLLLVNLDPTRKTIGRAVVNFPPLVRAPVMHFFLPQDANHAARDAILFPAVEGLPEETEASKVLQDLWRFFLNNELDREMLAGTNAFLQACMNLTAEFPGFSVNADKVEMLLRHGRQLMDALSLQKVH